MPFSALARRPVPATCALAALLTALAFAGPTAAQTGGAQPRQAAPQTATTPEKAATEGTKGEVLAAKQFKWLDTDGDGFLTQSEVALFPRLRDNFEAADTNRDGKVSFEEIRVFAQKHRAERDRARQAPAAVGNAAPTAPAAATAAAPRGEPAAAAPAAAAAAAQVAPAVAPTDRPSW
ncbi:EF-hand domain-containing protein [Xylophilus ampelinus]|uniref:EF hand domain-containing protein n=1 Tax=Xylophilus ampelinus TaxID=54067 RepID=A0A318SJ27_9BURK|nr:EF-hand domain-containing protein [Xylophilus ampelinus]MCS4511012.1 EF-hand domain-containing protein [Xylophilus ampelinus]PYE75994.1 EF hand domain-containing protein [Xylophilus ampelinus]